MGIGVTARLDGDSYVLNGRKYWPCNVGGWDGQGANTSLYVVRIDPGKGGSAAHTGSPRKIPRRLPGRVLPVDGAVV